MSLVVKKCGGTSVATPRKIESYFRSPISLGCVVRNRWVDEAARAFHEIWVAPGFHLEEVSAPPAAVAA